MGKCTGNRGGDGEYKCLPRDVEKRLRPDSEVLGTRGFWYDQEIHKPSLQSQRVLVRVGIHVLTAGPG